MCWKLACSNLLVWMKYHFGLLVCSSDYQLLTGFYKHFLGFVDTDIRKWLVHIIRNTSGWRHLRCLIFSLVSLDRQFLLCISIAKFNLVTKRLVRLILRLAILYVLSLNSLLFSSSLSFATCIASGTVTFHVWHFVISFGSS